MHLYRLPWGAKGYKLWIDKLGKQMCFISKDLTFNEFQMAKIKKCNLEVEPLEENYENGEVHLAVEEAESLPITISSK